MPTKKNEEPEDQKPEEKKDEESKALIIPPSGPAAEIAIFRHPQQGQMIKTIKETFKGGVNVFRDLERIKNPTSGSNTFRVPSAEGEKRLEKLTGVIVAWRDVRVFFDKEFGSGPVGPPACSSNDGITGVGNPGGDCATCRYARFGSKEMMKSGNWTANGKAQGPSACRQMRQILFLRDGLMPEVINVTPGSLNQAIPYIRRIVNYGKLPYHVLTEISLESSRSGGGIEYSQLRFKMLTTPLTDQQKKIGEEYFNIFQPALHTIDVSAADYGGEEKPPF